MKRWLTVASLVAVAVAVATAHMGFGPTSGSPSRSAVTVTVLTMETPSQVDAGQPIPLMIGGVDPAVDVEVTLDGGYGPQHHVVTPSGEVVDIEIPPLEGPASGRVLVTAAQPDRVGFHAFDLVSGPPADPLTSYVGPRTIVADAEHSTMIVTVPLDARGNPVELGTVVDYRVTRPDRVAEEVKTSTLDLLSWHRIYSRTVAGRTLVTARSGEATGPEQAVLEVAGRPEPFELEIMGAIPPADGRALLVLGTEVLVDGYGNILPDGVIVYLDIEGVTGRRRLSGVTIDGVAEFTLEAPDQPGSARAVGHSSGVIGNPLTIEFSPAVEVVPTVVTSNAQGRGVRVGPVRTISGAYVPDATMAVIRADEFEEALELEAGVGSLLVPADVSGSITVEVLGAVGRAS